MLNDEDNNVLVSILCTTYNHEKYIEQAIQGFLAQKTTFRFEILIHEDASEDSTAAIILKYAKDYPSLIKPIIQKQNQYSQGVIISRQILLPIAKGKYIALCEGDDYWIDPYKLQKQINYLEENNNFSFSFTNAVVEYNGKKNKKTENFIPWNRYESYHFDANKRVYNLHDLVRLASIPTASFVIRKNVFAQIPRLSDNCFQGDRYIELFCISKGPAFFLNECTCVYRKNVEGSATSVWKNMKVGFGEMHPINIKFINMYDEFDKLTNGYFKEDINILRIQSKLGYAINSRDIAYLKKKDVKEIALKLGLKTTIKYYLAYLPFSDYLFLVFRLVKEYIIKWNKII